MCTNDYVSQHKSPLHVCANIILCDFEMILLESIRLHGWPHTQLNYRIMKILWSAGWARYLNNWKVIALSNFSMLYISIYPLSNFILLIRISSSHFLGSQKLPFWYSQLNHIITSSIIKTLYWLLPASIMFVPHSFNCPLIAELVEGLVAIWFGYKGLSKIWSLVTI